MWTLQYKTQQKGEWQGGQPRTVADRVARQIDSSKHSTYSSLWVSWFVVVGKRISSLRLCALLALGTPVRFIFTISSVTSLLRISSSFMRSATRFLIWAERDLSGSSTFSAFLNDCALFWFLVLCMPSCTAFANWTAARGDSATAFGYGFSKGKYSAALFSMCSVPSCLNSSEFWCILTSYSFLFEGKKTPFDSFIEAYLRSAAKASLSFWLRFFSYLSS